MNNLKSFVFRSSINENVNSASVNLDTWGVAPNIGWVYNSATKRSTFNIEGFKNINIHAMAIVGDVGTRNLNTGFSSVCEDYAFQIRLNGTTSPISGFVTFAPNTFSVTYPNSNEQFFLSKYIPKIEFLDPVMSVKTIEILDVRASGTSAESLVTLNIGWLMNFIVYYTYEGEDLLC